MTGSFLSMMRRFMVCLGLLFLTILAPMRLALADDAEEGAEPVDETDAANPYEGQYETESGHALRKEQLAPVVYGGYPESGAYLLFAPWDYINFGGGVAVRYDPYFRLGMFTKIQMLETDSKRFNLALAFQPGMGFNFKKDQHRLAWMHLEPAGALGGTARAGMDAVSTNLLRGVASLPTGIRTGEGLQPRNGNHGVSKRL